MPPENGNTIEGNKVDAAPAAPFQVQETITVPDRNLSPAEMAKIMRQVSCVCNFLSSLIMKQAAIAKDSRTAGAGHPICQNILNCAAQADSAALQLAGPPQIMQAQAAGGRVPVEVPGRGN